MRARRALKASGSSRQSASAKTSWISYRQGALRAVDSELPAGRMAAAGGRMRAEQLQGFISGGHR